MDGRGTDNFPFQASLAGEIQQADADKKREYTLAWQNQHGETHQYQNHPESILNQKADPTQRWMALTPSTHGRLIAHKIIRTHPADSNKNQRRVAMTTAPLTPGCAAIQANSSESMAYPDGYI
jgi:hypothetical protein